MIWTPSFYGRQKRSFQLQYDDENAPPAADAGSTTGVSARTGTTGPRSYISNISMRVEFLVVLVHQVARREDAPITIKKPKILAKSELAVAEDEISLQSQRR
jgi:hypothetical protein